MKDERHKVLNGLNALENLQRVTKQGPPIVPREDKELIIPTGERTVITPRLIVSPFHIDHRGEVIKEMRDDAAILDKQAAHLTHTAISLRIAADHLEQHPPEP